MVNQKNKSHKRRSNRPSVMNNLVTRPIQRREQQFRTTLHANIRQVDISAPPVRGAEYFTISQCAGYANLLTVFDQYRVRRITITFIPQVCQTVITSGTVATVVPTSLLNLSTLATCVDQDDAVAPASEAIVLAHESGQCHGLFNTPYSRTFVPMVAKELYQTGGFGGYSADANSWVDSASSNVQYYGIKYSVEHGGTLAAGSLYFLEYVDMDIEFRKVF